MTATKRTKAMSRISAGHRMPDDASSAVASDVFEPVMEAVVTDAPAMSAAVAAVAVFHDVAEPLVPSTLPALPVCDGIDGAAAVVSPSPVALIARSAFAGPETR